MTFSGIDLLEYKTVESQIIAIANEAGSSESKASEALKAAQEAKEKADKCDDDIQLLDLRVQGIKSDLTSVTNELRDFKKEVTPVLDAFPGVKENADKVPSITYKIKNLTDKVNWGPNINKASGSVCLAGPETTEENILFIELEIVPNSAITEHAILFSISFAHFGLTHPGFLPCTLYDGTVLSQGLIHYKPEMASNSFRLEMPKSITNGAMIMINGTIAFSQS